MTQEPVVVLAVTKMLSGMCTGGISLTGEKWIRPVKEFGTVLPGDLAYPDRTAIRPFDIVKFSLTKPFPRPPHVEDWVCDFVHSRPTLVGRLDQYLWFLEKHSEPDSPEQVLHGERSLALFEPSQAEALFAQDSYSGKYEARLKLPEMGERPVPVTDIKWRALGRRLLGSSQALVMTSQNLRDRFDFGRIFVALGLSRLHEGKHWPLIVGVHTWPDYGAEVDYGNI
ncbi:MAG: hypothetical protein M1133_03060 [Armatimonadetes bacterium]|nr:hypothetical protein [Armatimonadota bacterium]